MIKTNKWFTKVDVAAAFTRLTLDILEGNVVEETDLVVNGNFMYYFLHPDGYIEVLLYAVDDNKRMIDESQYVMALIPMRDDDTVAVADFIALD